MLWELAILCFALAYQLQHVTRWLFLFWGNSASAKKSSLMRLLENPTTISVTHCDDLALFVLLSIHLICVGG